MNDRLEPIVGVRRVKFARIAARAAEVVKQHCNVPLRSEDFATSLQPAYFSLRSVGGPRSKAVIGKASESK